MKVLLIALLFLSLAPAKERILYRSLNPKSIPKHLAYYHLFPETEEGKQALKDAFSLMNLSNHEKPLAWMPDQSISTLVTLFTKPEGENTIFLSQEDIDIIDKLAEKLPNRLLKGFSAKTEEEVLSLVPNEVDLAKSLLLSQNCEDVNGMQKVLSYTAVIDLMALQILTEIKLTDTPEKKIAAINHFIFEEMGFRFPPHSVYAKDIDLYTYLPSVIDSRRGVCLGVSILYLALSQRLGLPLEAITPPGHIYVRYNQNGNLINIETTARGIHLDSEEYMGLETTRLKERNIKEVVGLAYFNEASVHWQNEQYEKALKAYEKAIVYLPEDPLLLELMGLNYLFLGQTEKGNAILKELLAKHFGSEDLMQESMIEDYLAGKVDPEGLRSLFLFVDEKKESLLNKKQALLKTIEKFPEFRAAYFNLAVTWLQLNRQKEALHALEAYEKLEKNDGNAEYLMAELYATRSNFPKAWEHLHRVEELLKGRQAPPKTLKQIHRALSALSPE